MKEFTYGELKQALVCCTVYQNCKNYPMYRNDDDGPEPNCTYHLMSAAMNCINAMEKDLIDVSALVGRWKDAAISYMNKEFLSLTKVVVKNKIFGSKYKSIYYLFYCII